MEFRIESVVYNGVLCIDEILGTRDYKLIKQALETYPITKCEIENAALERLENRCKAGDWRFVLEYAVDTEHPRLLQAVFARDTEYCVLYINKYLRGALAEKPLEYPKRAAGNQKYLQAAGRMHKRNHMEILAFIEDCKKRILAECALKFDMERTLEGLDEGYFREELSKGNHEIIIIKLCVRLEAVLKGKYRLEGELSQMLDKYCSEYGRVDDGWGYYTEAEWVKTLHKLRMCRNNIVHPEKGNGETLTMRELEFCIDYICKKV